MGIAILQKKLKALGYKNMSIKNSNVILLYMPKSERNSTYVKLGKQLSGWMDTSFKVKTRISSAGAFRTEDDYLIGVKPDQSKTLNTDEQETLQGIYIACKLSKPTTDYNIEDLRHASKNYVNSKFTIDDLYEKAGGGWATSSIKTANKIAGRYRGKYYVQQRSNSKFVTNISNAAKVLVRQSGWTIGLDKWNPADVWLVKKQYLDHDFKQYTDIIELNDFLFEKFKKDEIIGVSLKAIGTSATAKVFNDGTKQTNYEYKSFDLGKVFSNALNGTVYYKGGSLVIRNFGRPESVSGEINGKFAQGGKVGAGPFFKLITKIDANFKTETHQEINLAYQKEPEPIFKKLYEGMQKFQKEFIEYDKFRQKIKDKGNEINYIISKYQVLDVITSIDKMNKKQKNKLITSVLGYASSELEISSIFLKVS